MDKCSTSEADAQAAAAAEAARRERIYREIEALQRRVNYYEDINSSLRISYSHLEQLVEEWQSTHLLYTSDQITSQVYVTNLFEGTVAEKFSIRYPDTLELMHANKVNGEILISHVNCQIGIISSCISDLRFKISALYASL